MSPRLQPPADELGDNQPYVGGMWPAPPTCKEAWGALSSLSCDPHPGDTVGQQSPSVWGRRAPLPLSLSRKGLLCEERVRGRMRSHTVTAMETNQQKD
jgi:hypothetical protein